MEGRVVKSEDTTVTSGVLLVLLFCSSRMVVLDDSYSKEVLAWYGCLRNIETASLEGSVNSSEFFAVEVYLSFPVDAVKLEPCLLCKEMSRNLKLVSVPEICVEI